MGYVDFPHPFVALIIFIATCLSGCAEDPPQLGDSAAHAGDNSTRRVGDDDAKASKPDTPAGAVQCKEGEVHLALDDDSSVSWVVVKTGNAPVIGTHAVSGQLAIPDDSKLTSARMSLLLSLDGSLSGHQLRDDRLRQYIFGTSEGYGLTFELTGVITEMEGSALPLEGVTLPVSLNGVLHIAGREIPLVVPVMLTGTSAGLQVHSGVEGVNFDLRTQLGLDDRLDALLALVDAQIDETLHLRFELSLHDLCG